MNVLACTDRSCSPSAKIGRRDIQGRGAEERMMRGRAVVPRLLQLAVMRFQVSLMRFQQVALMRFQV